MLFFRKVIKIYAITCLDFHPGSIDCGTSEEYLIYTLVRGGGTVSKQVRHAASTFGDVKAMLGVQEGIIPSCLRGSRGVTPGIFWKF